MQQLCYNNTTTMHVPALVEKISYYTSVIIKWYFKQYMTTFCAAVCESQSESVIKIVVMMAVLLKVS